MAWHCALADLAWLSLLYPCAGFGCSATACALKSVLDKNWIAASPELFLVLLFYGCIVPVGFLMRLSGKDPLNLRYQPNSGSYWIKRIPPGPDAASFKNQF
jgi:hypothetical protein